MTVDVNPMQGRHRAAACADLCDVVLAQLHAAELHGTLNIIANPVPVLICCDTQHDTYVWFVFFINCKVRFNCSAFEVGFHFILSHPHY